MQAALFVLLIDGTVFFRPSAGARLLMLLSFFRTN